MATPLQQSDCLPLRREGAQTMRRVQRVSPLPNRAFDKSQLRQPDFRSNDSAPVPTANPERLTTTANRLILPPDERSLQVGLVRIDRTVPVAGRVGSRDPCPATPTQR